MASASPLQHPADALSAAIFVVLAGSLPQLLAGPLAPSFERDLGVTPSTLGLAVSLSAVPALLFGVRGGAMVDRRGAPLIAMWVCVVSIASMLSLAVVSSSTMLVAVVGLAGCTRVVLDATSSRLVTDGIPPSRRMIAFGRREATVPAVVLGASLLLPLLDDALGWRAVVAIFALVPVAGLLALVRLKGHAPGAETPNSDEHELRSPHAAGTDAPVLTVGFMVGIGLMFMAANVLNAFAALSLDRIGVANEAAVVAAGALGCVMARLAMATWASTRASIDPRAVIGLSALVSVLAFVGMALPWSTAHAMGVIGAYCFGWGWTPLLFALVTAGRESRAGRATGRVAAIYAAMSILGPAGGGILGDRSGFAAVWVVMAIGAAVASMLIFRSVQRHPLRHPTPSVSAG